MFELPQELKDDLAFVNVKFELDYRDNCYYLNLDGSNTFPDVAMWGKMFDGFENFCKMSLGKNKINPVGHEIVSESCINYCIGSVLDFLK